MSHGSMLGLTEDLAIAYGYDLLLGLVIRGDRVRVITGTWALALLEGGKLR